MGIGLAHAFHKHDNSICMPMDEQHFHQETDCDQLHYFSQALNHEIELDVSKVNIFWSTIDQPVYTSVITLDLDNNDLERGPPVFNVL